MSGPEDKSSPVPMGQGVGVRGGGMKKFITNFLYKIFITIFLYIYFLNNVVSHSELFHKILLYLSY